MDFAPDRRGDKPYPIAFDEKVKREAGFVDTPLFIISAEHWRGLNMNREQSGI